MTELAFVSYCIVLYCIPACSVLYCIALYCAEAPVVSGKELCIVRPEVKAAVTDVVLYCTVFFFIALYWIVQRVL